MVQRRRREVSAPQLEKPVQKTPEPRQFGRPEYKLRELKGGLLKGSA